MPEKFTSPYTNSRRRVHAYCDVSFVLSMKIGVNQDCPVSLFLFIFSLKCLQSCPLFNWQLRVNFLTDRKLSYLEYMDNVLLLVKRILSFCLDFQCRPSSSFERPQTGVLRNKTSAKVSGSIERVIRSGRVFRTGTLTGRSGTTAVTRGRSVRT